LHQALRLGFAIAVFVTAIGLPAAGAPGEPSSRPASPQPNVWITFDPGGGHSSTSPQADGSEVVSVGDMDWPIFSVRLRPPHDGRIEVDLVTPAGFDEHYIRAADWEWIPAMESDEYRLELALAHHRPAVRFRVDRDGTVTTLSSREFRRHQDCARRLLRASIEAQMRDPSNAGRLERLRRWARSEALAGRIAPPVETASLLLRLAALPLPDDPARDPRQQGLGEGLDSIVKPDRQLAWLSAQVRAHGRAVRLQIDLRSDRRSAAARLCRELRFVRVGRPRSDSCTIEGIIHRGDGWPLTIRLGRQAVAVDGGTQGVSRRFARIAPLEGFQPPHNPCSTAGG
jgi:hypothetical protein